MTWSAPCPPFGPRRVLVGHGQAVEPEADGSPNVIGAVAPHAAMDTLSGIGWPAISAHEHRIATSMRRGLAAIPMRRGLAAIPGVRLLGPGSP